LIFSSLSILISSILLTFFTQQNFLKITNSWLNFGKTYSLYGDIYVYTLIIYKIYLGNGARNYIQRTKEEYWKIHSSKISGNRRCGLDGKSITESVQWILASESKIAYLGRYGKWHLYSNWKLMVSHSIQDLRKWSPLLALLYSATILLHCWVVWFDMLALLHKGFKMVDVSDSVT
jgi:hypothetical protein